jgi:hypothetical protein
MEQPFPSATLTLLFSDIEGSTRLLSQLGVQYGEALAVHRSIIREEVQRWRGHEIGTEGDSFFIVFALPSDAVGAALAAQHRLTPTPGPVTSRFGCGWDCTPPGQPTLQDGDYIGMDVHGHPNRLKRPWWPGRPVRRNGSADRGPRAEGAPQGLGMAPARALSEPERIFQLVADGLERDFPPLKSLGNPTTPSAGSDSHSQTGGRTSRDCCTANTQSAGVRLVTLTAPEGRAETRLAIAAADRLGTSRADGVYFVPLATATTADVMWSTIAESLGVSGEGRAPPTFYEHIRSRDMLLILDNLEQLAEASQVVSEILAHAPRLAVLATSRRPLHLTGETASRAPLEILTADVDASEAESWERLPVRASCANG